MDTWNSFIFTAHVACPDVSGLFFVLMEIIALKTILGCVKHKAKCEYTFSEEPITELNQANPN